MVPETGQVATAGSDVQREIPQVDPARAALVKDWCQKIEESEEYWKPTFDQMRADARFARGRQWPDGADRESYVANITHRHIKQHVSATYAKNPKVRAVRRKKIYSKFWDGTPEMAAMAQATVAQSQAVQAAIAAGMPLPPMQQTGMDPTMAQTVLKEVQDEAVQRRLYDSMGQTLELVAQYSLEEPIPKFKPQAKQLVRRVLTCKVGYLELGYQRVMKFDGAALDARIKDATDKIKEVEMLTADAQDGKIESDSKEAERLRLLVKELQQQKELVLREGLTFSFPQAWEIVCDPAVRQLKGFIGASWVSRKFIYTTKEVQKIFNVDVGNSFQAHKQSGARGDKRFRDQKFCAVYYVYDLVAMQCFCICLGYPDFLKEPGAPDVKLEQFHPYYVLTFNDIEPDAEDDNVYPPSDVELLRPMQVEYNRSREGLRIHRLAERPAWVTTNGTMDGPTKAKFASHDNFEIIDANLPRNVDINKVLMPKPTIKITPELYEVENAFVDTQRVAGDQPADLGGVSGATATESQLAARSRATGIESNIDDLDEFFTEVMRGASQILFLEMSINTVREIAGDGAVWPEFPAKREQVARELQLEVRAGSSGKPNRQARLTAIEKTAPFLLQIPDLNPSKIGEHILGELDAGIDIDDFRKPGTPSITAMNAMAKPNLAPGPGNDAQGPAGAQNAPAPAGSPAKTQNLGGSEPPQLTGR